MPVEEGRPRAVTLHGKMAEVQGELGVMPKDRKVDVKKNGELQYSYEYLSESALMSAVRQRLAERGVAVYVSTTDQRREGNLTMVAVAMTFADGETGETFTITGQGQGADQSDKGVYKAITGAVRYLLWKTFLVPTEGDDPNQPHDVGSSQEGAPTTIPELMGILEGYTGDAKPWVKEAIEGHYPDVEQLTSFRNLPPGVQRDAFTRLQKVARELVEEPKFDPYKDPDATQALLRRAFRKAFEGLEVQGPDPFDPPIPF